MKKLTFVVVLFVALTAHGQPWSGILDSSRAENWQRANVGVSGGIPTNYTQCGSTIAAYTGTAGTINTAISGCGANTYVLLGPGTFSLSTCILVSGKNNIEVRGSGPLSTTVAFTGGCGCNGNGGDVCLTDATGFYEGSTAILPGGSNSADWTGGYVQGATSITFSANAGSPPNGQVIILDQRNDTVDTNGMFICNTSGCTTGSGNNAGRTEAGQPTRGQVQFVKITNVAGTTLTITPPVYHNNVRTGQAPGMWWTPRATKVGISNVTLDHSGSTSVSAGVFFYDCDQCWMKNVRSLVGATRNHVWIYQSSRVEVRDSYLYSAQAFGSGNYGVECFLGGDNLIENNIIELMPVPLMEGNCSGNVFGYNLINSTKYTVNNNWNQQNFDSHNNGTEFNLLEGNAANGMFCDDIFGSSGLNTIFRNRVTGWQTGKTINTHAISLQSFCRAFNIIGNVLGQPTYHTVYEDYTASGGNQTANCALSVYQLGFPAVECSTTTPPPVDFLVRSSLMRWGNYDVVNAAVRFDNTESSPAAITYVNANSTPASHTLPSSFYLSAQPSFFTTRYGTPPYPPIGPDVTGGTGPGGFAYAIPAELCLANTSRDGSGILLFDASVCYTAAANPQVSAPGTLWAQRGLRLYVPTTVE